MPFLDSDAEIEAAANMTIAEIFERDGEAFFRDRETEVLDRLLENECGILSTGGGAFLAAKGIGRSGVVQGRLCLVERRISTCCGIA